MIDLRQAIKVNDMLGNRHRIGILKKHHSLPPGTVVLFTDVEGSYCTIETPITDSWIERNIKKGNGIRTINTCVCFPVSYIEEVLL